MATPVLTGVDHKARHEMIPVTGRELVVAAATIFLPPVGVVAATLLWFGQGGTWLGPALAVLLYCATVLGITVGFHRLYTHRSFRCPRLVRLAFGAAGSMAAEGPLFFWVAIHRSHHSSPDTADDPHSPHLTGDGPLGTLRGLWHSHIGWMLARERKALRFHRLLPDLLRNRDDVWLNRTYLFWVGAGLLIPGAVGWLVGGWETAIEAFVWGGPVRMFVAHHMTWSINSVCHRFGRRPFTTGDESRNVAMFALPSMGESWHNNHHAFPSSARHGLKWWQLDPSYVVILTLAALRLAWDVNRPPVDRIVRSTPARTPSVS